MFIGFIIIKVAVITICCSIIANIKERSKEAPPLVPISEYNYHNLSFLVKSWLQEDILERHSQWNVIIVDIVSTKFSFIIMANL